jgi:hypothetical protein
MRGRIIVSVMVGLVGSAAGCGSGSDTQQPTNGGSVLTAGVVSATFASTSRGYAPALPQGAACDDGLWNYVITLAAHDVVWTGCAVNGSPTDPASYTPAVNDFQLDDSSWAKVHAALAAVTVSDATSCGSDKNDESLTTATASQTITYGDDFYACHKEFDQYVTTSSLDQLSATLYALQ